MKYMTIDQLREEYDAASKDEGLETSDDDFDLYVQAIREDERYKIVKWVPVGDFTFQNYDGPPIPGAPDSVYLTCRNHPTAEYSTKNPYQRSLHFLRGPDENPFRECDCHFDALVVLVDE